MKYRPYFLMHRQFMRFGILIAGLLVAVITGAPAMARAETPRWKDTLPALRIQVDAQRHRLWVLNFDAVYLYDIPKRRLIKRIELPNWTVANEIAVCAPDLALTPAGAALVTSNVVPTIWVVDPRNLTAREHILQLDADHDKDVGFTGLAFGRSVRDLIGVSSLHGSAWKIDIAAGTAYKVRLSEPIRGSCGVVILDRGTANARDATPVLCIAGAKNERRVELTSDMRAGLTSATSCGR